MKTRHNLGETVEIPIAVTPEFPIGILVTTLGLTGSAIFRLKSY